MDVFDPLLVRFPISTTTDTIDTTALTMLTTTPTLLPICCQEYATHDHQYVTSTIWPTITTTMYQIGVIASIGIDW